MRTRTHMFNWVTLTKRFREARDAVKWVRADVARLKSLPPTPKGWLKDRPRWEVIEDGKVTLRVDEWGREEAA